MKHFFRNHIRRAIDILCEQGEFSFFEDECPPIDVIFPKDEAYGDYTTNIALVLAGKVKKNPMNVAERIVEVLRDELSTDEVVANIVVVRPGYINFTLAQKYFEDIIREVNDLGMHFGDGENKMKKVMVEYANLNTHKEFHIGHLRNVFVGFAVSQTLRKAGYDVITANYGGDTGTHVAKCLWGMVKFHLHDDLDAIPNKAEFLGKVYTEASQSIAQHPEYEDEFKFDAGDEDLIALWKETKQWSLDEFERLYRLLGVSFDAYFYESEEEIAGKKLLPELFDRGIVKESDGAIIADLEEYNLGVLVLVRKDGGILYGLKDIPLAKEKFEKFGVDRSVVVVDVRQSLYFKQLFKILELYGFHKETAHVGYDFVTLSGGEGMSSRKGNIITANSLIEHVTEDVRRQFPESPDAMSIAIGAIRFSMLKHSAGSTIEFDIAESVKLDGATGPYVQYAHARIAGILRKADECIPDQSVSTDGYVMHEKEIALVREIEKFPELIADIAEHHDVHKISHYALRIADRFHSFYSECKVVDTENIATSVARIHLVRAVKIVLAEALRLIGVSAPERM